VVLVVVLASVGLPSTLRAQPDELREPDQRWGLLVYGGVLTDGNWKQALTPGAADIEDSQLVALAGSYIYEQVWDARLSLEVEGSIIKHFGLQEHVELTVVPLAARWHRFPWGHSVRTSLGLGGGLSYAARPPAAEIEVRGDAEQLLFHWYLEATAGPPRQPWEGALRLHHRSGGFGLLGTQGRVGSDFLTVGLRWRF
jgi:hypothetical protein